MKNKVEFSKKILIFASVLNVLILGFSCYMIYITRDLTPLCYLIPSVAGEVATGTGFYYAKAKAENKIKLMKDCGVQPSEESFREGF